MIDTRRVRTRLDGDLSKDAPLLYWMNREMRVQDNWALLYTQHLAKKFSRPFAVMYNLDPQFIDGGSRQVEWKLQSLKNVDEELSALNIPFFVVVGSGADVVRDGIRSE